MQSKRECINANESGQTYELNTNGRYGSKQYKPARRLGSGARKIVWFYMM